ncbi:hypothetical protein ABW19_dt0203560 [Dactylella cylindrospora]|nr:hypothetical protein ABW19_dt0203560 [Dactylella cylindrospora]
MASNYYSNPAFDPHYQAQAGMKHTTENVRQQELTDKLRDRAREANLKTFVYHYDDKLGYISVFCLIVNRMIGTGIFEQPSTILAGSGSPGASLLLWALGAIIAFSGLMVHIEYGLTIPRYPDRSSGGWVCIPRSGGEKNYFEFLFRKQKLLPVCIYGVIFVFLGNTAGNSIVFADYFMRMCGNQNPSATPWIMKLVAVGVISFACFMHSIWRKGGIYMLNILAIIKVFILWTIIVLGYVARAGHFESVNELNPPSWSSFETENAFHGRTTGIYGWAIAILGVLYAFGGYENANYVLSEIKNPRKVFPRATITAVVFTSITYILTIVSYYIVVPAEEMFPDANGKVSKPVLLFFGQLFSDTPGVQQGVSALVALSSFGNLMTVTFVASRVKQEIAKEGILPFYKFWEMEWDSGWRSISDCFTGRRRRSNDDTPRADKTPIPALLLHWITSLILILAPPEAIVYQLFTRMYAYMIHACFGVILGGGLLYLRYIKPLFNPRFEWVQLAEESFNIWKPLRPVFPAIYLLSASFLVIGPFIQHGNSGQSKIAQSTALKWYIFPTVCLSLFGVGTLYWLLVDGLIPLITKKRLVRHREADIDRNGDLDWEGVKAKWLRKNVEGAADPDLDDPQLPRGSN